LTHPVLWHKIPPTITKNADEDEYASKRFPESRAEVLKARQKRRSRMDLRVVKRKIPESR
jgi:hypothetical protein